MPQLSPPRLESIAPIGMDTNSAANFDTSVAALVINFGAYPFHQSSLGIIRSLGRLGIPVFAIQRNAFIPSGASRYLSGRILWRTKAGDRQRFVEGMATIARILDRPAILVPADDLSAILIAENADKLSAEFIFARPSPALPRTLANKRCLYELCHRLGIACPETFFPASREELLDLSLQLQFPVVAKATEPWLLQGNIKSTAIVSSRENLIRYYDNFVRLALGTTLMIQRMIPSSTSEDWFVHGYCDNSSDPSTIFTGIKLRSYPSFAGPTTLGRSIRNDALREQAISLFSAIGYRGIMDLDFRMDKRDGHYNLLDFNPRIGAQFRLFEDDAGIDVVRALHLDLTGRGVRTGSQVDGRTFIVEIQDLLASLSYYRSGVLTMKAWLRSLRGIAESAWCAGDDLAPFFLLCLWMFYRGISRLLPWESNRVQIEAPPTLLSK